MALLSRRARAALSLSALALCACNGHQKVFAAVTCDDPCCGGPMGIDCAEHPNVACVEPGDACSAMAYGCVNRVPYIDAAVPASCSGSSDSRPIFVLPEADVDGDADADATIPDAAVPDGDAAAPSAGDASDATVD